MVHFVVLGELFVAGPSLFAQESVRVVDVCEVMDNLEQYDNTLVSVQGELSSCRHGSALFDRACLKTDGRVQTAICIWGSGNPNSPEVPFETESAPLLAVSSAARALYEGETGFRSTAVIRGQLFVAPPGKGFCHLNSYRVLMVAKELVSYSVKREDAQEPPPKE